MTDVAENPRAVIGGNEPPLSPYEEQAAKVADLDLEAKNWLDGTEIENSAQADEVTRILGLAKSTHKATDAARVTENEPFDTGKAEVQARYNPLLKTAKTVESAAKIALAKWGDKELERMRKEAEEIRAIADAAAFAAQAEYDAAQLSDSIEVREDAEAALDSAALLDRTAKQAEKEKPIFRAEGLSRGLGLSTEWNAAWPETDRTEAEKALMTHYWRTSRADLVQHCFDMAQKDIRAGARTIPGIVAIKRTKI